MSDLLEKFKKAQGKIKKKRKEKLNPNSSFSTLTNDEIALVLALRAKKTRLHLDKKQKDISSEANLSSSSTYPNFEQKGTISLLNFIKVIRAFGKLHELEQLLKPSVQDKIDTIGEKEKQRIK